MPQIPFDQLPAAARVWVFAASRPVTGDAAERLLDAVDRHLEQWAAHGAPLTSGRAWTEEHFLTVAVDQRTANASGCSIDGLFRTLQHLEREIGASLVGGGRVLYRDSSGTVHSVTRDEWSALGAQHEVDAATPVFDPTVTSLGDWRDRFETPARESWQGALLEG